MMIKMMILKMIMMMILKMIMMMIMIIIMIMVALVEEGGGVRPNMKSLSKENHVSKGGGKFYECWTCRLGSCLLGLDLDLDLDLIWLKN